MHLEKKINSKLHNYELSQLGKLRDLRGSRMMPPPGLHILLWPPPTLTFDLLTPVLIILCP